MTRRRTPQEKKILSYARDRRNSYGESDKASRKNIPRSKGLARQAYRSKIKQTLQSGDIDERDVAAEAIREKPFDKSADAPLARYIEGPWRHRGAPRLEKSELREEAKRRLRRSRRG